MKKILAVALSVLMIISVLPFAAFAADELPQATVTKLAAEELKNLPLEGGGTIDLDIGYRFTAQHDADTIGSFNSKYKNWIADYVIYVDKDVAPGAVTLAGQYNKNADEWVTLSSDDVFPAGYQLRLLESKFQGEYIFTYSDICSMVRVFNCGAVMNDESAKGTKITVELRLFESEENNPYQEVAGGQSVVINKFEYTFGENAPAPSNDVVPTAEAVALDASALSVPTADGTLDLDVGYKFVAEHTKENIAAFAENNKYANCPVDFIITADEDIAAGSVTLAGYYAHNDANWVTLTPEDTFAAGTQFKLLENLPGGPYTFTYVDIVNFVGEFYCGAKANDASAAGKTMSVSLCLFPEGEDPIVVDSFNYEFRAPANDVLPTAEAVALNADELSVNADIGTLDLDVGYKFVAEHTKENIAAFAANNKYANCPIDFVISADKPIAAGAVTLAGYYEHHDANWVTLTPDAAYDGSAYRLLEILPGGPYTFTYVDLVNFVGEFRCGAKLNDASAAGTTLTVELRIFPEGEESIVLDSFTYKLEAPVEADNGANLTVGGELVYNTYIDADAYGVEYNTAVLKVTYNKNSDISRAPEMVTDIVPLSETIEFIDPQSEYNETYKLSKTVAPAQITEPVVIELFASEDAAEPLATLETSVYKMLTDGIADPNSSAELKAFYEATIDYAKAAQAYFNYRNDLAGVDYTGNVEGLGYDEIVRPEAYLAPGVKAKTFSITCKSNLEVNIFYNGTVNSAVVTGAAEEVKKDTVNNKVALVVSGIRAQDITKQFVVETDAGLVKLSASNVIRSMLYTKADNVNLKNLMSAVYLYGVAADAYFGA